MAKIEIELSGGVELLLRRQSQLLGTTAEEYAARAVAEKLAASSEPEPLLPRDDWERGLQELAHLFPIRHANLSNETLRREHLYEDD